MKCIYIPIIIVPQNIALCKYYIEAQDNIGYLRVLDPRIALLHVVTTCYQEKEMRDLLHHISCSLSLTIVDISQRAT